MAEAYRGLTIRIGGEVSGLSKALKSANSAIRTTQSQLRNLSTALRLDPGNTKAAELQVGAIATQAVNAASKLELLKSSYSQLGSNIDPSTGKTFQELAETTDNAALAAQRAGERYSFVDEQLARLYQRMTELSKESGLGEVFNADNSDIHDINAALALFAENGQISRQEANELANAISSLKEQWQMAFVDLESAKTVAGLQEIGVEAVKTEAQINNLASEMARLSSESSISKSVSGISKELQTVSVASDVTMDRFRRLDQAFQLDSGNLDLARQRAMSLKDATDVAQKKADLLQQKLSAYKAAGIDEAAKDIDNVALAAEQAQRDYISLQTTVSTLKGKLEALTAQAKSFSEAGAAEGSEWGKLQADIAGVSEELSQAEQKAARMRESMDTYNACAEMQKLEAETVEARQAYEQLDAKARGSLQSVADAVAIIATAMSSKINQALNAALDSAVGIDAAYRNMRKTVNGTEAEFENLRQAAYEFSQTHVTSADQMLEIEALGGQFGIAVDNLQSFAEAVSNLDVATDISADDAALQVGQMINVLQDFEEGDVDKFTDALVRLGNNVPATESSIMNVAQRISSVGSISGMTTPEVLAWAAALASTGQKSESAATALTNTMTQIESAVAGGGEKLDKFASIAGLSAQDFADSWNTSPTEAMKAFIEGLNGLDMENQSVIATLEDLGIGSVRQKQALMGLTETVNTLDDSLLMSQHAWDGVSDQWGAAGDAAIEAQKKADGLSGAMSIMQNTTQVLGAELGEGMVPFVQLLNRALGGLAKIISSMSPIWKTAVVGVGGVISAISVAAPVVSTFSSAYSKMIEGMANSAVFQTAGGAVSKFVANIGGVVPALGVAALAIGALGVAIEHFSKMAEEEARTRQLSAGLREINGAARSASSGLLQSAKDVEELGYASRGTTADMDALVESVERHAERMREIRDETAQSNEQLENAHQIISEFAGKTDLSAEQQGKLKWALEQVNEQLGLNLSAEDVLAGQYEDEEGVVHDLTQSLDELIKKRKEEARIAALGDMLKEAYNGQYEAQQELTRAQDDYNRRLDELMKFHMQRDPAMTEEEAKYIAENSYAMRDYKRNLENAQLAVDTFGGSIDSISEQMGILQRITEGNGDSFDELVVNSVAVQNALATSGNSLEGFAGALRSLGVPIDELSEDALPGLAEAYDGTMQSILDYINEYNAAHIDDKEAQISVDSIQLQDASGNVYTWNGTDLKDQDGNVVVDEVQLTDALGNMYTFNNTELKEINGNILISGNDELGTAISRFSSWNGTTLRNIYGYARMKVDEIVSRSVSGQAAGGYIPRHADGFIATRATMTNVGWIGEAGAEAYTGNSLVPLTNTKYSQPFIDLLADGVISKLGNINSGPTYQVYFNDVEVNSDDAFASAFQNLMYEAARKADM